MYSNTDMSFGVLKRENRATTFFMVQYLEPKFRNFTLISKIKIYFSDKNAPRKSIAKLVLF
jgi:hypothetical protein